MTGNARIQGSLRTHDGTGVVRIEATLDVSVDDAWAALTDPAHLAGWYGVVEGDLRIGGEYRARVFASDWEGVGRVETCGPRQRFSVAARDPDEPNEHVTDVALTADGEQLILVIEQRGLPVERVAAYGAGMQIHVEDLAAHLAGRGRCDADARWDELQPVYDQLPVGLG
jgi:uncharacterized protein YndB with AHSA1/START domain